MDINNEIIISANICRVCSSRGDYDIFSVIPSYLHAGPNDFLHWKKDISALLEETTGLTVDPNDGLPQKMCALCISYLKHAATFRQQAIENILSLKAAQVVAENAKNNLKPFVITTNNTIISNIDNGNFKSNSNSKNNNKNSNNDNTDVNKRENYVCVSVDDLIFNENRKTDTNRLINNILNHHNKCDEYVKKFLLTRTSTAPIKSSKLTSSTSVSCSKNKAVAPITIATTTTTPTTTTGGRIPNSLKKNNQRIKNDEDKKNNMNAYLNLLFEKEINKTPGRSVKRRYHRWNSTEAVQFNWSAAVTTTADAAGENSDTMGEDFQTASSDDNEIQRQKLHYFSYKEKNFEEDDITELDIFKEANIIVNIPEYCEERKCRACFRRFMFEDSLQEHKKICVEFRFLIFIEEINRLVEIRRNKAISPHEFIRRMIFFIRKMCEWLITNCGERIDLPDLVVGKGDEIKSTSIGDGPNGKCDEGRSRSADAELKGHNNKGKHKSLEDALSRFNDLQSTSPVSTTASETNECYKKPNSLLDLLRSKADSSFLRYDAKISDPLLELLKSKDSPTPRTKQKFDSISSESSYCCSTIEQNLLISNEFSKPQRLENGRKSLLESFNQVAPTSPLIARPIPISSNHLQLSPYSPITTPVDNATATAAATFTSVYPKSKLPFSARCNACDTIFESIGALEEHNAKFHNNPFKLEQHKRIIALFEGENAPNNLEGSVDVINIINRDPLKTIKKDSSNSTVTTPNTVEKKMTNCSMCDKKFPTIIQLDQHKAKYHLSGKI